MHSRASACAILALVTSLAYASGAGAQSPPDAKPTFSVGDFQFTPLLEVRIRGEYRHSPVDMGGIIPSGQTGPVIDDAWAVMERSRLGIGAERGPLRAQVTFQDARAWGQSPPLALVAGSPAHAAFGAYETFIELHTKPAGGTDPSVGNRPPALRETYFRLGRQAVTWGDGRILGNADWSPSARTLDAARLHIATTRVDVELLAAILDSSQPLGAGFDDVSGSYSSGAQLYGAYFGWTIDPLFKLEAFGLARLQSSTPGLFESSDFALARASGQTYTGALRVSGDGKPLEYSVAGYVQGGNASLLGDARSTRLAYAVAGDVGRRFDGIIGSPKLRIGAAMASGDDGAGNYGAFDPILPDVNVHYGVMNVFALSNLIEAHAALTIEPTVETRVGVEYRYARMVNATGEWMNGYLFSVGRATFQNQDYELGHELDLFFRWRPLPQLDLLAGYGGMLLGSGAKAVLANQQRGAPDFSHFGYLTATVRIP